LTLNVVSKSPVTWATSVSILVFLGLSVLDLLRDVQLVIIRGSGMYHYTRAPNKRSKTAKILTKFFYDAVATFVNRLLGAERRFIARRQTKTADISTQHVGEITGSCSE